MKNNDNKNGFNPLLRLQTLLAIVLCFELTGTKALASELETPVTLSQTEAFKRKNAGVPKARAAKSSFPISYGAGIGLNFPDIAPLEGFLFFGEVFGLRAFFVPPIPFNIRVEMPRDKLSSAGGIVLEHPDLNIDFEAKYGPQYGVEGMYFPTGDAFFISFGTSYRRLSITGGAESPLILTAEDSGASTTTNTNFSMDTSASAAQIVTRLGLGWFWRLAGQNYFSFNIGYTLPRRAHSDIDVTADMRNPQAVDPTKYSPALDELRTKKEAEVEARAKKAMKPVEELALPVIGFAVGMLF